MVKRLRYLLSGWRVREQLLRIPDASRDREVIVVNDIGDDAAMSRQLLAAMLAQAMNDGMTGLSLIAPRESGQLTLSYYQHASGKATQSWDMIPPHVEVFPAVFQLVVRLARFSRSMPLEGVIIARRGPESIPMRLRLSPDYSVDLSWGPG